MLYAVLVPNSLKPDKFEINVFLATILLLFCQYCKILRITYYVLRITYEVTLVTSVVTVASSTCRGA